MALRGRPRVVARHPLNLPSLQRRPAVRFRTLNGTALRSNIQGTLLSAHVDKAYDLAEDCTKAEAVSLANTTYDLVQRRDYFTRTTSSRSL